MRTCLYRILQAEWRACGFNPQREGPYPDKRFRPTGSRWSAQPPASVLASLGTPHRPPLCSAARESGFVLRVIDRQKAVDWDSQNPRLSGRLAFAHGRGRRELLASDRPHRPAVAVGGLEGESDELQQYSHRVWIIFFWWCLSAGGSDLCFGFASPIIWVIHLFRPPPRAGFICPVCGVERYPAPGESSNPIPEHCGKPLVWVTEFDMRWIGRLPPEGRVAWFAQLERERLAEEERQREVLAQLERRRLLREGRKKRKKDRKKKGGEPS